MSKTIARTLIVLAGIGAAAYLLAAHGIDQVFRALQLAGWSGLTALTLMHVVTTVLCVWAAGRIFRVGLLMQGKGARLGEMVRWVFRG